MLPKPAIEQREHNSKRHTCNICNPILHIRAAPKGRLDKLYDAPENAGENEDGDQSKAARTCQREGECCKGNEVYKFIGAIKCWGRLVDGPEHGHCQNGSHD